MKRAVSLVAVAAVMALLILTFTALPASAHEVRLVGDNTFIVGFLDEPAYAQVKNSLDLTICTGKNGCIYVVKDGQRVISNPVNDADKTLKVEVSMGSAAPLALTLAPRYGNPGKYSAYFMPSTAGSYTFHIFGKLANTAIDEKFTSGPHTFGNVETVQAYPAAPATQGNVDGLQNQVKAAQASAATATTIGIAGTVLGVLGLAAAGFALMRKPRAVVEGATGDRPVGSLRE